MEAKALSRLADRVTGARLVYGDPVVVKDRTVIPVARVRAAGGLGTGDEGSGGGGALQAQPVGFIEVTAKGSRYESIPDPDRAAKSAVAGALVAMLLSIAAVFVRRAL